MKLLNLLRSLTQIMNLALFIASLGRNVNRSVPYIPYSKDDIIDIFFLLVMI